MTPPCANPVVHMELHTGSLERACDFYARLFDWQAEAVRVRGCHGTYTTLEPGGGIGGGVVECGAERPLWLPYVEVADLDRTTSQGAGAGRLPPAGAARRSGREAQRARAPPTRARSRSGSRGPEPPAAPLGSRRMTEPAPDRRPVRRRSSGYSPATGGSSKAGSRKRAATRSAGRQLAGARAVRDHPRLRRLAGPAGGDLRRGPRRPLRRPRGRQHGARPPRRRQHRVRGHQSGQCPRDGPRPPGLRGRRGRDRERHRRRRGAGLDQGRRRADRAGRGEVSPPATRTLSRPVSVEGDAAIGKAETGLGSRSRAESATGSGRRQRLAEGLESAKGDLARHLAANRATPADCSAASRRRDRLVTIALVRREMTAL